MVWQKQHTFFFARVAYLHKIFKLVLLKKLIIQLYSNRIITIIPYEINSRLIQKQILVQCENKKINHIIIKSVQRCSTLRRYLHLNPVVVFTKTNFSGKTYACSILKVISHIKYIVFRILIWYKTVLNVSPSIFIITEYLFFLVYLMSKWNFEIFNKCNIFHYKNIVLYEM